MTEVFKIQQAQLFNLS